MHGRWMLCTDDSAKEHHEGGGDDETLVQVLAFAVVDEDPNGNDIEDEGDA